MASPPLGNVSPVSIYMLQSTVAMKQSSNTPKSPRTLTYLKRGLLTVTILFVTVIVSGGIWFYFAFVHIPAPSGPYTKQAKMNDPHIGSFRSCLEGYHIPYRINGDHLEIQKSVLERAVDLCM